MEIHKLDVEQTNLIFLFKILSAILVYDQKVNVGNDQEMAQSETNSHSKNRGGKTKLTIREQHIVSLVSSYIPKGGHAVT